MKVSAQLWTVVVKQATSYRRYRTVAGWSSDHDIAASFLRGYLLDRK